MKKSCYFPLLIIVLLIFASLLLGCPTNDSGLGAPSPEEPMGSIITPTPTIPQSATIGPATDPPVTDPPTDPPTAPPTNPSFSEIGSIERNFDELALVDLEVIGDFLYGITEDTLYVFSIGNVRNPVLLCADPRFVGSANRLVDLAGYGDTLCVVIKAPSRYVILLIDISDRVNPDWTYQILTFDGYDKIDYFKEIEVDGDYLYGVFSKDGEKDDIIIIDIQEHKYSFLASIITANTAIKDFVVDGNVLAFTDSDMTDPDLDGAYQNHVKFYDITDKANPVNINHSIAYTNIQANFVDICDNFLYIMLDTKVFEIYEFSDTFVFSHQVTSDYSSVFPGLQSMRAIGNSVFTVDTTSGNTIREINVTTKTNPMVLPTAYNNPEQIKKVCYDDSNAYFIDDSGFYILELSDYTPYYTDEIGIANEVAIDGNYAYLADGMGGVRIIKIFDPAAPQLEATALQGRLNVTNLEAMEQYVYVPTGTTEIFAIEHDGLDEPFIYSIDLETKGVSANTNYISLNHDKNWGYVALSGVDSPGGLARLYLDGSSYYFSSDEDQDERAGDAVMTYCSGSRVFTVSDVGNVFVTCENNEDEELMNEIPVVVDSRDATLTGLCADTDGWLYISKNDGTNGWIEIWDVSDPDVEEGIFISDIAAGGLSDDIIILESLDLLVVANGISGIQVFDINDRTSPQLVNSFNPGGYSTDIASKIYPDAVQLYIVDGINNSDIPLSIYEWNWGD